MGGIMHQRAIGALATATLMVVPACRSTAEEPRRQVTFPEVTPTAEPEEFDLGPKRGVLRILESDGRFDFLFRLIVEETSFVRDVMASGGWNHTLFAPTDAAFDALPDDQKELLDAGSGKLIPILDRHITIQVLPARKLRTGELITIRGEPVRIGRSDGEIRINDALVIEADLRASNGMIHVIDAVIQPLDG